MKFIAPLTSTEQQQLEAAYKNHSQHRVRQRAHAVLLNAKGYAIPQLVKVFGIGRDAISAWLDAWAAQGLRGLQDEVRLGRPAVLTEGDLQELKILIDENPHQLKMAVAQFEDKSGKKAELITYRRAIKKF